MTIEQVGVRRAEVPDAAAIATLQQQSQLAVHPGWTNVDDWAGRLANPEVYTYLAETEQAFGAVAIGRPTELFFDDGNTREVLAWYLTEPHQQHGYGRQLLVHGLTVVKRVACERAIIWIPDFCERALAIADRLGFEHADASRTVNAKGFSYDSQCYAKQLEDYF